MPPQTQALTVTKLIQLMDQALNNNATSPRAVLDRIFGTHRTELDDIKPTKQEVQQFLPRFRKLLAAEVNKEATKRQQRFEAIQLIEVYLQVADSVCCFDGVAPERFAFQLALRVREPSMINQALYGTCGPAAMMVHFAKLQPKEFAKFAIGLAHAGTGVFRSVQITPKLSVRRKWNWSRCSEADYIVLASMACAPSGIKDAQFGLRMDKGVSTAQIESWLTQAGYDVHRHIMGTPGWHGLGKLREHLQKAATLLQDHGRMVIFGINEAVLTSLFLEKRAVVKVVNYASTSAAATATRKADGGGVNSTVPKNPKKSLTHPSIGAHHWILVTRLQVNADSVDIKFYSWGADLHRTVPLDIFASYYNGFIEAEYAPHN